MSAKQEDCVELKHDAQRVFEAVPIQLMSPQMIMPLINSMGMPPIMKNLVGSMIPTVSIMPTKVSINDLPKSQCVWIPHAPNANIIRIIGRYHGEKKSNPQLIISSDPININEAKNCAEVCANKSEQECMCIDADKPITSFDEMNGREQGFDQTAIWVTPHIDGGKKYIATLEGDIGFQVLGMFTHILSNGNPSRRRISNLKIGPKSLSQGDLMYIGGKNIKNVLLHHLNDNANSDISHEVVRLNHKLGRKGEMPPPVHKVNLVVQLKKNHDDASNESPKIKITALPLIHEHGLQHQYIQNCKINQNNPEQCSMYIRDSFDYDIRFENHGATMIDVDVFTVEIPTNDNVAPPKTTATPVLTPKTVRPPLEDPVFLFQEQDQYPLIDTDQELPEQSGRPSPIFNIFVVIAIILISLIGLFSILRINRKKRKAKARQAYVDDNGDIIVDDVAYQRMETPAIEETMDDQTQTETQTPFVSMDEYQLSYQVFSVPSNDAI